MNSNLPFNEVGKYMNLLIEGNIFQQMCYTT